MSVRVRPCPSVSVRVRPCSSVSVRVRPCPSVFVRVRPCSSLFVRVRPCSVRVRPCPCLSVRPRPCLSVFVRARPCSSVSVPGGLPCPLPCVPCPLTSFWIGSWASYSPRRSIFGIPRRLFYQPRRTAPYAVPDLFATATSHGHYLATPIGPGRGAAYPVGSECRLRLAVRRAVH